MPPVPKPNHKRNKLTAKQRGDISPSVRKQLLARSQGCCERCGACKPLQAAHSVRRWKIEGRTTVNELIHLCVPCHYYCDNTGDGREWLTQYRDELIKRRDNNAR